MMIDFNEEKERELLDFVQKNYGTEVFTPGLERTRDLYKPYKDYFKSKKVKIAIIAGTNGKGQTAHTLGFYLRNSGKSYALWTSPHILSLRERFSFNGEDIGHEELKKELLLTHEFLKSNSGSLVSFYEFLFLVFLRLAAERSIDYLILEVGLGGRLDAVNHFDADVTCITSISRDHQAILGNRYDLILSEKIAVSRKDRVLITQFQLEYLNEKTKIFCDRHGIIWKPISRQALQGKNYFEQNQLMARTLFFELVPGGELKTMPIPSFKGRREEMTFKGNTIIFIGAHNIDGIRSMIPLFDCETTSVWPSRLLLSFSKRPEDEVEVMLKTLVEHFGRKSEMTLTHFEHPKALEEKILREVESKINKINKGMLDFVTDWKIYLNQSSKQKILVCGSYYFIGEVQRFILSHSH